ncbi:hypothetical protein BCR35DRAFT_15149 [Leucosporidium creatinivorum]|uniref:Fungal-specific transcription factor domain-domain-containing protein n=1 Tax=Leucosporidium creatinivorum TaxID=106004 RepID=A0A1Y2FYT0_9BASI|nr:hypothetical protein BCR35DRAFT_15149 [Leucosporidium creatinivorum]
MESAAAAAASAAGQRASAFAQTTAAAGGSSAAPERPRCDFDGCEKTFLTTAHVVRHQRSAHGTGVLHQCPECSKSFARTDVLGRHISAVHQGERDGTKKIKKNSCAPCRGRKIKCDGVEPDRCSRCVKLNLECDYKKATSESRPSPYPSTSTSRAISTPTTVPSGSLPTPETQVMDGISPSSTHSYHSQTSPVLALHPHSFASGHQVLLPPPPPIPLPPASVNPMYMLPPISMPQPQQVQYAAPSSPPQQHYTFNADRASAALNSMAMPPLDYSYNLPAMAGFGDMHNSFDTSLGWSTDDTTLDFMDVFGAGALLSQGGGSGTITPSTGDWLRGLGTFPNPGGADQPQMEAGPSFAAAEGEMAAGEGSGEKEKEEGEEGRASSDEGKEGGAWPHIYRPGKAVAPLSLPTVTSPADAALSASQNALINDSAVDILVQLIHGSHSSPWQHVALSSFPDAATLRHCVDLYFRRFHPSFPVLSQLRLERISDSPPAVLLLAVVAIGASFDPQMSIMALPLAELTRRVILYLRESDPRLSFELHIIQAWLLSAVLSVFCGSRKLYLNFEDARSGLVTAARRMHLLRPMASAAETLATRKGSPLTEEEQFLAYLEDEERLRLGWGIYHFDTQVSSLLNLQPLFAISEVSSNCQLPDVDERFCAPNAAAWAACSAASPSHFRTVMDILLREGRVEDPLYPFGMSIVAVSLYRLCLDSASSEGIFGSAKTPPPGPYRLGFAPSFVHNPQALLDTLASSWYHTATPSPLLVSASAMAMHASIMFTCGPLLFQVKEACGKWGNGERRDAAVRWLETRMREDVVGLRRITARAAQLNALLLRFASFENPIEVVWLFDAALTLFSILTLGGAALLEGPSSLTERTSITWNAAPDSFERWAEHGGPLSLKGGLGEWNRLSPSTILEHFGERLETQPWGLARRYCAALASLAAEEDKEEEGRA